MHAGRLLVTASSRCLFVRGLFLVLCLIVLFGSAQAQTAEAPAPAAQSPVSALLRVFLDCGQCDTNYLRQNVAFVDYVRDRAVADLHVFVTTQSTGGGGREWTLKFIGIGRFSNQDRTLTFTTPQTATSDDERKAFARVFKLGLVGYAADTPAAGQLDVSWTPPATAAPAAPTRDPWRFWVFRLSGSGDVNGEQSTKNRSYRVSFSANRTTDAWKVQVSGSRNSSRGSFEIDDDTTIISRSRSWNANVLIVKSLGPRWSLGGRASASHSSFSNLDRSVNAAPGIEFNIFPYSQSARRSLTVQYTIGATAYDYRELTVFDKLSETVPNHNLNVALGLQQPWGSLNGYVSLHQHLSHTDRYRSNFWGGANVRLFKGFSFNAFGEYSKIKDQIGLPKAGVSTEEVLLRLRQLRTNYSYYLSFGLSYSFGSIFNSIVNTRFDG